MPRRYKDFAQSLIMSVRISNPLVLSEFGYPVAALRAVAVGVVLEAANTESLPLLPPVRQVLVPAFYLERLSESCFGMGCGVWAEKHRGRHGLSWGGRCWLVQAGGVLESEAGQGDDDPQQCSEDEGFCSGLAKSAQVGGQADGR